MNLFEAERYTREQLEAIYDKREASNIADIVLEDVSSLSRIDRLREKEMMLHETQLNQLNQYIRQLLQHEPVQYVIHKAWFCGMELYVDQRVLIPRPETEELVSWIISDSKASGKDVFIRRPMQADDTTKLKILDVGTGSGCIALALKKNMPKAEVWGCDVSEEALNVARRNGSLLDIRVDFQGLDFLDLNQQKLLPTVNILVSNPPYVPLNNKEQMHQNVVQYEPHTALFVPAHDPLVFYRALAQFGHHRLYPHGKIYMEIHEDLGEEVVILFENEGYHSIELRKDMQEKDRMVCATI